MGSQLLIIIFFPGMTTGLYLTGRGPKKKQQNASHIACFMLSVVEEEWQARDTKLQINTFCTPTPSKNIDVILCPYLNKTATPFLIWGGRVRSYKLLKKVFLATNFATRSRPHLHPA